ncbi:serine/threonine-protein kinase [Streptomyces sp. NPDC048338]|uniref:serine/threonine-protein kinase n=1 Tax=Streptomyces sp. NPDC048338 TaxID=3365536 RepID=UPI003721CB04
MQPLEAGEPTTIGAYRLLGRLGAGGMGRVYLARNAGGRTVAVKVVHPHFALDEQFRERFRREVEAARRVGGAWTAPVLDADTEAAVPWVASGYVAGPTLARAVETLGPLPEHTVRTLGAGLAEALSGVHALGLVHRDVKPSNLILTLDGPRLIDFGIARATDGTASLTATGVSVGSPGYMAPEQILGAGTTGAGDVFSLGAVLVYAATGAPPFPGDTSAALLYKVVHEEPELGALTGELRALVGACLAKDPAARPSPARAAAVLAPGGAASLVGGGWLPGPLVEEVSRTAVRLLELEPAARDAGLSGPVPFSSPSVGTFGPPFEPVGPGEVPPPRAGGPTAPGTGGAPGAGGRPEGGTGRSLTLSVAAGRRVSCSVALAVAGALAAVTLGAGFLFDLMPGGGDDTNAGDSGGRTSSPPAATAPTTAAPSASAESGSVPAAFVGTWTGPTTERNGSPHGDFTAVVAAGRTGEDVVRTTHEITLLGTTVRCHGIGKLASASATELRITERTDPDRPGTAGLCTTGTSSLTLTLGEDGTLAYRSEEEAAGKPTGTLRKS